MSIEPRKPGEKALVIGYGNPSRQDDGAGYHVVNKLNRQLGRDSLAEDSDGLDEPQEAVNAIWVHQLVPELAETISRYDMVIFVDAHTGAYAEEIQVEVVEPIYRPSLVSHHMKPGTLMALAGDLYKRLPRSILVSIRGYEFDFGSELSARTRELADDALAHVRELASV